MLLMGLYSYDEKLFVHLMIEFIKCMFSYYYDNCNAYVPCIMISFFYNKNNELTYVSVINLQVVSVHGLYACGWEIPY